MNEDDVTNFSQIIMSIISITSLIKLERDKYVDNIFLYHVSF